MSLHLLTAQIAQYFCRLSTVPRAHPFSRASWMRGQEVGGGGMQPRHGSLRGPLISRPDTPVSSARGSGWALREVNVLPIVGFLCPLKQQKSLNHPPTHPPQKKAHPKEADCFDSLSGTKWQERTGSFLRLWFHYKTLKKPLVFLQRRLERSYWKYCADFQGIPVVAYIIQ